MFKIDDVTVFESYDEAVEHGEREFPYAVFVGTERGVVDVIEDGEIICSLYLSQCELNREYPEVDEVELDYCPHCDCLIGACMCYT